jgi:hypothetical protein
MVMTGGNKIILGIHMSIERSMLVAERFIHELSIIKYGKHPIPTDGGMWYLVYAGL